MRKFNTLQEIYDAADGQVTFQEVNNGRLHLKKGGWSEIEISEELLDTLRLRVADIFGGHAPTKSRVYNALKWRSPQHWGLQRMLLQCYSKGAYFSYCAGQDQQWESNVIRTYLKKLY